MKMSEHTSSGRGSGSSSCAISCCGSGGSSCSAKNHLGCYAKSTGCKPKSAFGCCQANYAILNSGREVSDTQLIPMTVSHKEAGVMSFVVWIKLVRDHWVGLQRIKFTKTERKVRTSSIPAGSGGSGGGSAKPACSCRNIRIFKPILVQHVRLLFHQYNNSRKTTQIHIIV